MRYHQGIRHAAYLVTSRMAFPRRGRRKQPNQQPEAQHNHPAPKASRRIPPPSMDRCKADTDKRCSYLATRPPPPPPTGPAVAMELDGCVTSTCATDPRLVEAMALVLGRLRTLDKIDSPQYLQTALGVVMLAVSKKDDQFQTLVGALTGDCCLREAFDVVWDWAANHSDPAVVLGHLLQEAKTAAPERRAVLLRQLDRPDDDTSTDGRFLDVLVRALARELRGGLEVQQLPYGARLKAAEAPGTAMPLGAPGLDKSWPCGAESRVSDASTVPDDNPTIMAKVADRLKVVEASSVKAVRLLKETRAQLGVQTGLVVSLRARIASLEEQLSAQAAAPSAGGLCTLGLGDEQDPIRVARVPSATINRQENRGRRGRVCSGKAHDYGAEPIPETTLSVNTSRSAHHAPGELAQDGRRKEEPSEVADREGGLVAEGRDDQGKVEGEGMAHEHGPKPPSPKTPQRIPLASIESQQLNVPALSTITDQAGGKLGEGTTDDAPAALGVIEPWEERYISPAPVRGKSALRIEVSTRFSDGFAGGTADREVVVARAPPGGSGGAGANVIALGVGVGVGDSSNSHKQRLPRALEASRETAETAVVVAAATASSAQRAAASEETATQNWPLDSPLVSAGLDRELRRGLPASFEELAEAFSSAEHKSLFEHDMFGWASSKSSPVGAGAPWACGEAYRGAGGGGGGGVRRQRGASVENVSVEVKTDVAYYTVLSGGAGSSGGRDQPWMGLLDGGGKNPSVVVVGELAFFEANGKGEPSTGGHKPPPATGALAVKKSRTTYMKNAPGELKDDVFVYDEDQLSREIEAARSPSERRGQSSSSIAEGAPRGGGRGGGGGGGMDAERLKALQDSGVGFLCDAAKLDGGMFKLGRKKGFGGCSVIHALKMRKPADQRAVDVYTEGSGLVVKVVSQKSPQFHKDAMRRELEMVQSFVPGCHPNIVDYVSCSFDTLAIVMVAESCDLQELLSYKLPLESMGRGETMRFFAGGVKGLMYLHSRGYTHMDVKPANFMTDKAMSRLKVGDLGFAGRSHEAVSKGGTKEYMAPETMAHYHDPDTPRATLDPSIDAWSVGIMLLQVLFLQELPRTDPNELAIHGLMPKQEAFSSSLGNLEFLRRKAEQTGSASDQGRMAAAESVHTKLLTEHGMQQAKMQDLTTTLLCRGKWEEPGGLRFESEVTMLLLSLLDPNPRRRLPLSELLGLLECDALWAGADDNLGELPEPVRRFFAKMDERVLSPARASRGAWWPSNPWWMAPPPVSLIPELR